MNDSVTLSKTDLEELSIEDMLDIDLANVEDAAEFITPPVGHYRFKVEECKIGEVNEKQVIQMQFSVMETIELADTSAKPAPEGSIFSQTYFPGFGVQQFKTTFRGVAESLNTPTFRELIEALTACELVGNITNRKDKEDKTKVYAGIKDVSLV